MLSFKQKSLTEHCPLEITFKRDFKDRLRRLFATPDFTLEDWRRIESRIACVHMHDHLPSPARIYRSKPHG